MCFYEYFKEICDSSESHSYDLVDLQFDNTVLFSRIIEESINYQTDLDILEEQEQASRETELDEIYKIIYETSIEASDKSKSQVLDEKINRIKMDFYWQNIQSDDKVQIIYWQDCYDSFVSFMRQNNKNKMIDIFKLDISDMRNAGFSTHYISEIVGIFVKWSDKQLNKEIVIEGEANDTVDFEHENDEILSNEELNDSSERQNTLDGLLYMFFRIEEENI